MTNSLLAMLPNAANKGPPPAMLCIFGRPGAGKTSIANRALEKLEAVEESQISNCNIHVVGIDLDVCVPKWMKDNFAKSIYPTLEERALFADAACEHVEKLLAGEEVEPRKQLLAVISFSFVNQDLREIYRKRFPQTQWIFVDTSEVEAGERIKQREGHFYKGNGGSEKDSTATKSKSKKDDDNPDWQFAPIDFEHTILDGQLSIDENTDVVMEIMQQTVKHDC